MTDPYPQPDQSSYQQPAQQSYGQPLPPLAHWGLRVGASLIDAALLIPGIAIALLGLAFADPNGDPTAAGLILVLVGYIAMFAFAIWNQIFRQGRTGWSLGKQWLGIRLLSERTMAPIGAGRDFLRQLLHILDGFCYIGYLWPLWDAKNQTFADKIMDTVVVQQKKPA